MSMAFVAVGTTVAGVATSAYESNQAGQAAQGAATDQANAAAATRAQALQTGNANNASAMALASATPQELNVLSQSYDAASENLNNQQQLINQIDPSIMEASKQALNIMRGQTAAVNNPMMNLRNTQRSQLVNQLREQYGPGAETSAVGQKALQSFDQQSDLMFQQNQQNTLNQMFGIANTNTNAFINPAVSSLQQVGQGYGALQDRQLNAQINTGNATLAALSGTNASMVQTAGAPYVGAAVQAQGLSSLGNNLANTGSTLGFLGMKSGGFGSTGGMPSGMPPGTQTSADLTMPSLGTGAGYAVP